MDIDNDIHARPTEDRPPSTPRWVKLVGVIGLVLVLLIGIMAVAGGDHGPGRHAPPTEHSAPQP